MDARINQIFHEETKGDTSFADKQSGLAMLFGKHKYSQQEMRECWFSGIRHGIEIGLRRAGIDGQRIELNSNTTNEKHREFLEKFYRLAADYNCAIQCHPQHGMIVVSRDYQH